MAIEEVSGSLNPFSQPQRYNDKKEQTTDGGLFFFVVHLQGFEPGTH